MQTRKTSKTAAIDFPTEQLLELMLSPDARNNYMAGEMAKHQRGWNASKWAMQLLAKFDLEIVHELHNSDNVVTKFVFTLPIQGYEIRYTVEFSTWQLTFDKIITTREWLLDGETIDERGKYWGWSKKSTIYHAQCTQRDAAYFMRWIVGDWKKLWAANYNTETHCLPK